MESYHDKLCSIIEENREKEVKSLLLHACCAPCSTHCLEFLHEHFNITVYYYNPNISNTEEYEKRFSELKRLIETVNDEWNTCIGLYKGEHEPKVFFDMAKGLENVREGGERCFNCYEMRLKKTFELAAKEGYDYYATTLTLSPLKNAAVINEKGYNIAEGQNRTLYLPSDFKKKNGFKRSVELSEKYGLYRQNYCGCEYSKWKN